MNNQDGESKDVDNIIPDNITTATNNIEAIIPDLSASISSYSVELEDFSNAWTSSKAIIVENLLKKITSNLEKITTNYANVSAKAKTLAQNVKNADDVSINSTLEDA